MADRLLRAALVSDSHFDQSSRFAECIDLHDWIAEQLAAKRVDVLCHGGDLFERGSSPRERNAAAAWWRRCAQVCPGIMVRGNHDKLGDLHLLGLVETAHPVLVEESAGVHVYGRNNAGEYGWDLPELERPMLQVACLAWPRKSELLAAIESSAHKSVEASEQLAADALRDVLAGMGLQMDRAEELYGVRVPRLLLAHAMVTGSMTSTGQPLVGCDFEIGLPDLALARCDAVLLGHIHKGQAWQLGDVPIVYPGSPRRTAYGEVEAKGFTLVDCYADGRVELGFVEAPAQRMILLEASFDADGFRCEQPSDDELEGADVRFRYSVDVENRDAAKLAAGEVRDDLKIRGAEVVKLEERVVQTVRARTAEIAEAKSTAAKLDLFWRVKGIEVSDAQRARVLDRLAQVERETA